MSKPSLVDTGWVLTRAKEQPIIKRQRMQFFKSLVGEDEVEYTKDFELTAKEFLMMASLYQVNLNYLLHFLDHVLLYEGLFVSLIYIVLQLTLGMPLFMLYTFMSSYSKKSYLSFWDCVPILEGLGFTIAIITFMSELFNTTAAGLSLILIPDLFQDSIMDNMRTCNKGRNPDLCIPMNTVQPYTGRCESDLRGRNETIFIATQYYVRYMVMQYDQFNLKCCKINVKWTVAIMIVWTIIFASAIFGIKRVRKLSIKVEFFAAGSLFIVSMLALARTKHFTREYDSDAVQKAISQFDFWLDMIQHAAETNVIGNMIWLGTLKPKALSPRNAALIVSPIKLTIFITTLCWSSRIIQEVKSHYKFAHQKCLVVQGFDVIFVFVPDVLHRMPFGTFLAMLWYLGIFYFAILPPLYSIIGLVDSITEKYRHLNRYRLFVFLALCITGCLLNVCVTLNLSLSVIYSYRNYSLPLLNSTMLLIVTLALLFIYSTKRIVDDYNFTYGRPPHKFWCIFWKTTPILAIFALIMMLTQIRATNLTDIYANFELVSFAYVQSSLVLLPIVIIFLAKCCMHVKYRTLGSLTRPSKEWGPHNTLRKQARRYFYPQRDIKYRNYMLKCMHTCIANSAKYYEENRRQTHKLHTLLAEMEKREIRTIHRDKLFDEAVETVFID